MSRKSKLKKVHKMGWKSYTATSVFVLLLITALYLRNNHFSSSSKPTVPSDVNLSPATADEKKEADAAKDKAVNEQPTPSTTTANGKKQVQVIIVNADSSSVNAYVTGVFEDNGTCTATFTQNGLVISRTSAGFTNVSYTQCAPITPDLPNSSGWTVQVSYNSTAAEGTSSTKTF